MLSCVSCVSAKHTSGMVGAGLLEFCNLPLSQASIRATRHHNSKWPECNCGPAILDLTSFLSQTCNNITLLGKQTCIPGIAKCSMQGPIRLKIESSFHIFSFYVQGLKGNCSVFFGKLFFIYPARHGVPSPAVQFFKCGDKKVVR